MHKARWKGERGGHNYKQGGEEGRKEGWEEGARMVDAPPHRLPKYEGSYIKILKYLYLIGSYKYQKNVIPTHHWCVQQCRVEL
jgi:hypothetical protein